jgi:acetolactate synthase small subunit
MEQTMRLVIKLKLEDKPGTLIRVTNVLAAKGCNIAFLTAAPDRRHAGMSRMRIVAEVEPRLHSRIVNEMNRLVNVVRAVDVTSRRQAEM